MHPPQDSELPRGGLVVVNGHKEKNGHLYTWGVRSSWVHPELEKKNWILLFLNIQAGLLFEYLNQISLWTSSFFEQTSFWASNDTSSWTSIQTGLFCEHPLIWKRDFCVLEAEAEQACGKHAQWNLVSTIRWTNNLKMSHLNYRLSRHLIYIYICVCVCVCVAADFYSGRFCRSHTLWLKSQHSNQHVSNWLINDLSDFYGNSFIIRLTLGRHHYRKNW